MPNPFNPGAVVYARDLARLSAFYAGVAGLRIVQTHPDHALLESATFQLVIVAIPARLAASLEITEPPRLREDVAIKLALPVASLAEARALAPSLGGQLKSAEHEWCFLDTRVCDGHDPEGNVVQFRQRPAPTR